MNHKKRELWMGIVLLIFSIAYFAGSFTIPTYSGYGTQALDSKFMPRLLAVMMAGLSITHMIAVLRNKSTLTDDKNKETGSMTADSLEDAQKNYDEDAILKGSSIRDVLVIAAFLIFYAAAFSSLGFILSSGIFLFGSILFLTPTEKRNWFWIVGLSVVIPVAIYFLFVSGFKLRLPSGILNI